MRTIACILAVLTGLGLAYCFSSAQEAGKKEQEVESLELKLQQLRKTRLEENEKEMKQMVLNYYRIPKDDNVQADAATPSIVHLANATLRAILEATEQGKKRENLLVPFVAAFERNRRKIQTELQNSEVMSICIGQSSWKLKLRSSRPRSPPVVNNLFCFVRSRGNFKLVSVRVFLRKLESLAEKQVDDFIFARTLRRGPSSCQDSCFQFSQQ